MINATLTTREYEIAGLIASDLSQKMIADQLCLSPGTVHKHNANIREKWSVKTSVGIAVKYLQTLEHPKKFVLASLFVIIQSFIIFSVDTYEVRKVRTAKKIVKITYRVKNYV